MDSFRWISVALSIILGLGITRLLSSYVMVFTSRTRSRPDWIPLAWGGCIFVWQLQFWWAIIELPVMIKTWTPGFFLILVCLTLLLFVSASLVLPTTEAAHREGLRASFERDGRWALLSVSAYFVLALVADWVFWKVPPFSLWGAALLALAVLPLAFIASRSRRAQAAITVVYVLLSAWAALMLSPASYD